MIPLPSIVPNGSIVVSLAIFSMLSIFDIICLSSTLTFWASYMVSLVTTKLLFPCLIRVSMSPLVANLITMLMCNVPNVIGVCCMCTVLHNQ